MKMNNMVREIFKTDLKKAIERKNENLVAYHKAVAEMQESMTAVQILDAYIAEIRRILAEDPEDPRP